MSDRPQRFEEVDIGTSVEIDETYEVTAEEIVEFAGKYDPQPFHVDEAAAADSIFGGLVASGWHTCAMAMRLLVDGYLSEAGTRGALGVDDLRWHHPVRPGDVLRIRSEIVDKEPWSDGLGLVRSLVEVYAVDGDVDTDPHDAENLAMSYVALELYEMAEE
jgi:acyl dehydratase